MEIVQVEGERQVIRKVIECSEIKNIYLILIKN